VSNGQNDLKKGYQKGHQFGACFFTFKAEEMANTLKILFWIEHSRKNKEGLVPLKVRLTYKSQRANKASGYYVNPDHWNTSKQCMKGSNELNKEINSWIDVTKVKTSTCFKEAMEKGDIHLASIMDKLFARHTELPTLLSFISDFNKQLKERVGKDYTYSTYEKYVFMENKVKAFIHSKLKKRDILLSDITTKFIMDFDHYLRTHDSNQHNTAVKYCLNLKRVLNVAVIEGVLTINPLNKHKTVYKNTPQIYLSMQELKALEDLELTKSKYLLVRDLFVFQCNTGLAYTDMISLSLQDISIDHQGKKWIIKARQKTGIVSTIPLLPQAVALIDKYKGQKGGIFPAYSIQKYNQYIAEIGELAKLNKRLSSHVGRRTFGNIALAKGISINVISKILGHSNTIITQKIYAITTQQIISVEIDKWNCNSIEKGY
jgi:integrase